MRGRDKDTDLLVPDQGGLDDEGMLDGYEGSQTWEHCHAEPVADHWR